MKLTDIPTDILRELRYQAETKFKLSLYKSVEGNFLPALGNKHFFNSFQDPTYGYIGSLHLYWHEGAYHSEWFDKAIELIQCAEATQQEKDKVYSENMIIEAHMKYIQSVYEPATPVDDSILLS